MTMKGTLQCCAALGIAIHTGSAYPQDLQSVATGILEEVVVTGSYLGRLTEEDALAPLRIIDRKELVTL
ncbi:MAG TPA: hypothetical protein QF901_07705 [Gammaproteobacteria bacterium]|nr:hypothetical protein [Gammaproteobacteria bacterium]